MPHTRICLSLFMLLTPLAGAIFLGSCLFVFRDSSSNGLSLVPAASPDTRAMAPTAPRGSLHTTERAGLASALEIPHAFQGKIIRRRVRYFPEKLLALTFDDGPSPEITPRILRILREHQAYATFFVLGRSVQRWPELVRQAAREGHAIGTHSYSHPAHVTRAAAQQELAKTARLIMQATGQKPRIFRPPYGLTKGALCQEALREGYTVILWTISAADTRPLGPDIIAHNVIHTPNPGDIVLMHDSATHAATAAALPKILQQLSAAGFRFVTIPQLLGAWQEWQAKPATLEARRQKGKG